MLPHEAIHNLRLRSNQFCGNMNVNISMAIQSVDQKLIDLNRRQMLRSKDSEDKPLIHAKTGSPYLSKAYAKKTGKKKPDLFLDGTFQSQMFLHVDENKSTYSIDSLWEKTKYLVENYGLPIFGIGVKDQPMAKQQSGMAFKKMYKNQVLK